MTADHRCRGLQLVLLTLLVLLGFGVCCQSHAPARAQNMETRR